MRRKTWWGTTAVLTCGLTWSLGLAGDRDTYQSARAAAEEAKAKAEAARKAQESTWSWWPFGSKRSLTEEAEKAARQQESEKGTTPRSSSLRTETEVAGLMLREKAKFDRRQEVCDRLREIAHETGDVQLERQADLLEQRAWFVYEQRASLGRMQTLVPSDAAPLATRKPATGKLSGITPGSDRPLRTISAHTRDTAGGED
jgi:hypothetical protein